jgi:hypothetical protein
LYDKKSLEPVQCFACLWGTVACRNENALSRKVNRLHLKVGEEFKMKTRKEID